jgi:phage minor structural protein
MSYPILYEQIDNIGTVPNNNGLGVLTDCLECMITEERNGIYELEMKYPASGLHAKELIERRIIKAKPNYTDDPQLFRIYKITKVLNGSFTIYARHISYDLSGYPISNGRANSCVLACDLLQDKANGWTIDTDKEVVANFTIYEPSSIRSWFGGKEGSFLDVFGTGEWKYNNFTCSFLQHRGINRGVTVKYAKNLLSLNQDKDSSNVITAVIAYWKDSQDGTVIISDTKTTSVTLDVPNVYVLDCSSDFQDKPTKAQLNEKALNYINNHQTAFAKENIKLDFLQIGQLKDRVDLCDIVTINYEDFGISGTAKCITTTWDVLKDRYDSIEIGEPKTNIADTIVSVQKTSQNAITQTQMSGAIDRATALITGNSGGYVVLHDSNNDGQPDELLIMNTPDITTATKVWRWNLSGLGYSDTGYDGNYGLAMTMDGAINCAFLKTGNLVFGGTDGNTEGSLTIKDANDNVIANFNKSGCTVKGNITANSFTADAGKNVTVKILTKDTSLQPIGTLSGVIINNINSNYDNALIGVNNSSASYSSAMAVSQSTSGRPFISLLRTMTGINSATNYKDKYTGVENWLMEKDIPYSGVSEIRTHYQQTGNDKSINSFVECTVEDNSPNTTSAFLSAKINNGVKSVYLVLQQNSGNGSAINIFANDSPYISMYNNIHKQIAILGTTSNGGGYLYLRNSSETLLHQLDIQNGGGYIGVRNSSGSGTISLWGHNGNVTCVSLTQTSTRKVKENINTLTDEEAKKVLEIEPVTFDFIDKELGTNKRGFIAEDVIEVIPEIVTTDEDDEPQGINYTEIIPYLTKMIQIQQKQIEILEARVKELEERSL